MLRMAHTPTAELTSARVAERIKESGVTLVWLCARTGIPRTTMERRLRGQSPFNLNELDRIAEALRIPTTDLLAVAS